MPSEPLDAEKIAAETREKTICAFETGTLEDSVVNFYKETLTDSQIERVFSALANDRTVTSVCLQGSLGSYSNLTTLAAALTKNNTLLSINLSGNQIDDAGAALLADVLRLNRSSLKRIYLQKNRITLKGIKLITDALAENSELTSIFIEGNALSSDEHKTCANYFKELLTNNHSLTKISIDFNDSSNEAKKEILSLLDRNIAREKQRGATVQRSAFSDQTQFDLFNTRSSTNNPALTDKPVTDIGLEEDHPQEHSSKRPAH